MHELRAKGKEIYTGVLTVEDAEKEILDRVRKSNKQLKIKKG